MDEKEVMKQVKTGALSDQFREATFVHGTYDQPYRVNEEFGLNYEIGVPVKVDFYLKYGVLAGQVVGYCEFHGGQGPGWQHFSKEDWMRPYRHPPTVFNLEFTDLWFEKYEDECESVYFELIASFYFLSKSRPRPRVQGTLKRTYWRKQGKSLQRLMKWQIGNSQRM